MVDTKKVMTSEYYIAYIDLLGGTELIKKDYNDNILHKINTVYTCWSEIVNEAFDSITLRIFTDNIVLAIKTSIPNAADILLNATSIFAAYLLKNGFIPRGGIAKGDFYINEIMLWGIGFIKVYDMESNIAVMPRIIVDSKVAYDTSEAYKNRLLGEEKDGYWTLNYLRGFGTNNERLIAEVNEDIVLIQSEFERHKQLSKTEEKVVKKLNWLLGYLKKEKSFLCAK